MEYGRVDAVYTQYLEVERKQDDAIRKLERMQALAEAHRLYDAKIAKEQRRLAQKQTAIRIDDVKLTQLTVTATHYTSKCDGCTGITKTGDNVRNTIYADGYRVIAVDPSVIPLRSIVRVKYADGTSFKAIASDVGSAIKERKIDVLVASKDEMRRLGRQQVTVTILKYGKGR